jgi:hypothetical protein
MDIGMTYSTPKLLVFSKMCILYLVKEAGNGVPLFELRGKRDRGVRLNPLQGTVVCVSSLSHSILQVASLYSL